MEDVPGYLPLFPRAIKELQPILPSWLFLSHLQLFLPFFKKFLFFISSFFKGCPILMHHPLQNPKVLPRGNQETLTDLFTETEALSKPDERCQVNECVPPAQARASLHEAEALLSIKRGQMCPVSPRVSVEHSRNISIRKPSYFSFLNYT